ncbi:MAG TPA: NifB/NifX family molybdenum-iron cluster-binding protein [Methanoregulaceae archaeon]|nr:NifB/NifX family molybdenum-iron cluster-binding protein [Methanoregulaceae archaeon]
MKVCFTAKGATIDSASEERFGRAPYFIIVDIDSGATESVENPYIEGAGGVGPKAAQLLISRDVRALVSGQVGGNAREALVAAGIEIFTFRGGSVGDALEQFRKNALQRSG